MMKSVIYLLLEQYGSLSSSPLIIGFTYSEEEAIKWKNQSKWKYDYKEIKEILKT